MTAADRPVARDLPPRQFVAVSELTVPEAGRDGLREAFEHRLGDVDHWPGFRGLQVLEDVADRSSLMMISWWDDQECFSNYMRSEDHRRSHHRIPTGEDRPRPRRFRRYEVIAT